MFVTYFIVTFCGLTFTLTFLSMALALMQYSLKTFTSIFGEFELYAARLPDLKAQNVKMFHIDL